MYKIAICDDDKNYREKIEKVIETEGILPKSEIRFYEYESGKELLENADILHDLVFMDMRMPGLDGNKSVLKLREYNRAAILVFCSGYFEPTPDSINIGQPFRYIMKDLHDRSLKREIPAILSKVKLHCGDYSVTVTSAGRVIRIYTEDILYICLAKRGCSIYVARQGEIDEIRVSVRNIETIKDTGMYMAPNIQLFELDIDKESNIGKFFKGSDLVIGAIGPSADYSEKMLLEAMAENIPYVDPGGIHLIRKMRNSSMKGTAIVGSGIFPGLSGWMLSSVLKEAFNDDLIEMIIGGVYNFSKAAAIDYVEEIKSYKAGIPMACVRNGKILPAQKRSPLNLPTRISKLSILPYVTEEIQEIIQGKYMLNIDSYTAAPVSLFSIVNKAQCQKKDLVNALMGQKNSNQKAFIWVRQNKGNDSRCIYFEGKNPSVLTGEILAITANAIFEMPRKDGIYTMASYLEKYQVLDELKKIDKFKSEGKI